ncbi:MAG: glucose-6-phosphate dehydrogenase [Microbacterium sp.]
MKITDSSDWRGAIPFDSPVLVADLVPGEPTRCVVCGTGSDPRPRTELWAFKHRHPNNHSGYVRFYCRAHIPVGRTPAPESPKTRVRAERTTAPRRPAHSDEKPRTMCPNCFVEVSATGECGMCGWRAA